jgi:hypothetical protein
MSLAPAVVVACCCWSLLLLASAVIGPCRCWPLLLLVPAVAGLCCYWSLLLLASAVISPCCCWPLLLLVPAVAGIPAVPDGNCCCTSRTKFMERCVHIHSIEKYLTFIRYSIFPIPSSLQIFCDRFFKLLPKSTTFNETLQFCI